MLFTPAETKVVVVGGGTMGADVAAVCARGGCAVQVVEPTTERRALLPDYFVNTMTELGYENRIHLLSVAGTLEEVDWSDIDLVIECVPERLDIKRELFAKLEKYAKSEAVLASNSTSFPISQIAEGLKTPARMIGLHFFMPAHLIPCVEVIYGAKTSPMVVYPIDTPIAAASPFTHIHPGRQSRFSPCVQRSFCAPNLSSLLIFIPMRR